MGLLILVRLAGVDQDDVAALDLLRRLEGLDLLDLLLGLRGGHGSPKYPNSDPTLLQKV